MCTTGGDRSGHFLPQPQAHVASEVNTTPQQFIGLNYYFYFICSCYLITTGASLLLRSLGYVIGDHRLCPTTLPPGWVTPPQITSNTYYCTGGQESTNLLELNNVLYHRCTTIIYTTYSFVVPGRLDQLVKTCRS